MTEVLYPITAPPSGSLSELSHADRIIYGFALKLRGLLEIELMGEPLTALTIAKAQMIVYRLQQEFANCPEFKIVADPANRALTIMRIERKSLINQST